MTETKHDKNKILMVQKRKRGIDFMLLIETKKMLFHNLLDPVITLRQVEFVSTRYIIISAH